MLTRMGALLLVTALLLSTCLGEKSPVYRSEEVCDTTVHTDEAPKELVENHPLLAVRAEGGVPASPTQ